MTTCQVGHWIEVYWEGDQIWFRAQVRARVQVGGLQSHDLLC